MSDIMRPESETEARALPSIDSASAPPEPPPGTFAPWINKPYVAPPPGNSERSTFAVLDALREGERAKELRAAEDARREAFVPIGGGTVEAELRARQARRLVPGAPVGLMNAEQARAEAKRAEASISELERNVTAAAGKLADERTRQAQATVRVQEAKAKAARVRTAVEKEEQRRTAAAGAGDVARVEKATAAIADLQSEAARSDDAARALETAAQVIDLAPLEREHVEAAGKLLDERARLAVARLALELPALAETVRRKLGALLANVDAAIAACACASRAPANLHALDAGTVAAVLHRALANALEG